MKWNARYMLIVVTAACLSLSIQAQEPPPPGPPPHQPPEHEMVHRWMNQLRRQSPEEFERLEELRINDPQAFHDEIRQRVHSRRMRKRFGAHSEMAEQFMELPPDERHKLARELFRMERGDQPPLEDAYRSKLESLVETYQNTLDETERETLLQEIKSTMNTWFDLHTEQRKKTLSDLQSKINRLEARLEKRQARKDQIIDEQLDKLLKE